MSAQTAGGYRLTSLKMINTKRGIYLSLYTVDILLTFDLSPTEHVENTEALFTVYG